MLFFLHHGYRVIAHDGRGYDRSAQVGEGNDMDHYADDLADLTQHLDLHDARQAQCGKREEPGLTDPRPSPSSRWSACTEDSFTPRPLGGF